MLHIAWEIEGRMDVRMLQMHANTMGDERWDVPKAANAMENEGQDVSNVALCFFDDHIF